MAIMVTSFRVSVSDWLDQVLPADLYARLPASAAGEGFDQSLQTRIRALPGASQVEFSRVGSILLDERRPAVALVARPLHSAGVAARLPLTGKQVAVPGNQLGVWVSEPFADIYRVQPGDMLSLPIGNSPTPVRALVAGIWRDYARQHGAIAIDIDDYRRLTGDEAANEVAWWLVDRAQTESFIAQAQALSALTDSMEFRDTGQLKSLSLRIFDRSFAITHVLEAIAIAVALFGVATSVAGEALARQREFGMLRHLGLTRRQIGQQFAIEAALGTVVACLWGLMLGAVVAWVLVHRVNPQSFHWTMSMHWPTGMLATSALAMIMLAAVAARLSAREATGAAPVLAVRQDW
jgi:putative ABC transport system permease protein